MSNEPLLLGGISDDFTGGLELASMMARDGLRTRLLTRLARPSDLAELDVAVIALKSRVAPATKAVRDFARATGTLAKRGARQVFFKYCATFDSTPRGNIGPCADYLADRLGAEFTGFCPAFPDVERKVYRGHLFWADQLISDSLKRFDPLTPMRDPNLVRVLQAQTRHKVGLIRHEDLQADLATRQNCVSALKAAGARYAICDAVSNDDLRRMAEICVDWSLMTGGSSVAEYYPELWRARGLAGAPKPPAELRPIAGLAVILAGSCAEQTAAQIAHFGRSHSVHALDVLEAVAKPELVARALDQARRELAHGSIAFAVAADPDAVAAAQKRFGRRGAARRAEEILGKAAIALHRHGVRRFVIAGGETSGAVLEALKVRAMDISPYRGPGTA
ncbi:MAG TPA: 3-oxo-tetronate kinase, partial [Dongiaceae bacterium]|nr:3-oxo-tetronate kinase [Dongiaceae bacterium]